MKNGKLTEINGRTCGNLLKLILLSPGRTNFVTSFKGFMPDA